VFDAKRISGPSLRSVLGPAAALGFVLAGVVLVISAPSDRRSGESSHRVNAPARFHRSHTPLPPVRTAAVAFARSYVSYFYGRASAAPVAPITQALRTQLLSERASFTPAELDRSVVVREVGFAERGTQNATARAVVDDCASPPFVLSFDLSFRHGRWLVTGAAGGPEQ
jgi:hypothetical protein